MPPVSRRTSSTDGPPQPRQLPGSACEECRKRKLRCDRQRPQCGTCADAGIVCEVNHNRLARGPKKGDLKALRSRIGKLRLTPPYSSPRIRVFFSCIKLLTSSFFFFLEVALERRLSLDPTNLEGLSLHGDADLLQHPLSATSTCTTPPGPASEGDLSQVASPRGRGSIWEGDYHTHNGQLSPMTPQIPLSMQNFKFPPSPPTPPKRALIHDLMRADLYVSSSRFLRHSKPPSNLLQRPTLFRPRPPQCPHLQPVPLLRPLPTNTALRPPP